MWKFISSATDKNNWLKTNSREVAFIGRSNVGKSTLINALTGVRGLARVSKTPGRTQLINFFQDNLQTIVDLPGYGYAKMPHHQKEKMLSMIETYFEYRRPLRKVFLLIDARVGPTKDDLAMIDYLRALGHNFMIVLTKADKANQSLLFKTTENIGVIESNLIIVSALKGKNITKLRKIIMAVFK